MRSLKNYFTGNLNFEEEEHLVERLIRAKGDRDQRRLWESKLEKEYKVERQGATRPSRKNRLLGYCLAIAASLLMLLAVFYFQMPATQTFADQVDVEIASLAIMGDQSLLRKGPEQVDILRSQANLAYVNEEYLESQVLWEQVIAESKALPSDYFYLGICLLKKESSDPIAAISALDKSAGDPNLNAERNWILALAYGKAGQIEKAKHLLQDIVENKGYQSDAASRLLK